MPIGGVYGERWETQVTDLDPGCVCVCMSETAGGDMGQGEEGGVKVWKPRLWGLDCEMCGTKKGLQLAR